MIHQCNAIGSKPHYVDNRPGENLFQAYRRWKDTAPTGHRGPMFIR